MNCLFNNKVIFLERIICCQYESQFRLTSSSEDKDFFCETVLGILLKTSLIPNIYSGRKKRPSVRGTATCTGP